MNNQQKSTKEYDPGCGQIMLRYPDHMKHNSASPKGP